MPYKDKEIEKIYWSIGEVAASLGVSISMIRFWEAGLEILKPKRNKKGDRFYKKDDVERIKMIYHLTKEKGYTLKGAKQKILAEGVEKVDAQFQTAETLKKIKEFLTQLRNEL
ncbi:MAG: MerR family transcriptional regulator [Fimbriimonadaceae bacterium]|nr:MerR family transcriptional regulator [Chitinophagales bacterium]